MPVLKETSRDFDFQKEAKEYVINMLGKRRKLHKKNGCQFSFIYHEYYDFDSVEEAEQSGIAYTLCEVCFPDAQR